MAIRVCLLLMLVGASGAWNVAMCAAAPAAPVAETAEPVEQQSVLRFDPISSKLIDVPAHEIKPGCLYNRYSELLGRRVWSTAVEGGGFEYAMAPGSVQPARALDLRATEAQLREQLMERAPELAKVLDIRGGTAFVRLMPDETWVVVRMPTIANVFDLETGRRWEWHGVRRVAILHTGGDLWMLVDGKIVPLVMYGMAMGGVGCW